MAEHESIGKLAKGEFIPIRESEDPCIIVLTNESAYDCATDAGLTCVKMYHF